MQMHVRLRDVLVFPVLVLLSAGAAHAAEPMSLERLLAEAVPVPDRIEWEADGTALRAFSPAAGGGKAAAIRIPLGGGAIAAIPYREARAESGDGRQVTTRTEKPPAAVKPAGELQRTVLGVDAPGGRQPVAVIEQKRAGGKQVDTWRIPGVVPRWGWGKDNAVYATVWPGYDADATVLDTRVLRLEPGGRSTEVLRVPGVMQSLNPALSPDGTRLALTYDSDGKVWDDFVQLHVLDLAGGQVRTIDTGGAVTSAVDWAADGSLVFVARDSGFNYLARVNPDGRTERLNWGDYRSFAMTLSPARDKAAFLTEDGYGRRDVRVIDLATREIRVVHVANDPATRLKLGEFRRISWAARDGLQLKGWLVLPPDFDPNQRHPMLVDVHGGGPGSYLYLSAPLTLGTMRSPLEWHYWASRGWVVFAPDYRSAGDYGPGIGAARYAAGDTSGITADADDVADGVRSLLGESWIDPARVVGFGHSAGGARMHSLLVRTDLFRAGILNESVGAGAASYLLMMTTGTNAGHRFADRMRSSMGASFRDDPQRYSSGLLFDGWRIRAPTLIMGGGDEAKGAVPMLTNELLVSVLRERGVPTRYVRYDREGHNYRAPVVVRDAFAEVESWLRLHAGPN